MRVEIATGNTIQTVEIEEKRLLGILEPKKMEQEGASEEEILEKAMEHPIGTGKLSEVVHAGETVVLLTSDCSRPMPSDRVLSVVLRHLQEIGIRKEDILIIFARGSHRTHSESEMRRLVGDEIFENYHCADSCTEGVTHVGETRFGTPIDIDSRVMAADRRICLGNIEYHYFAGYSGGSKALMPGASTYEAIQVNHSQMVQPEACAGNLVKNPIRDDLEEAAARIGIDFLLNVVLDEHRRIVHAVAGDWILAHRSGCEYLQSMYRIGIHEKADIVLVSQGGAPKDASLYQTQKALDNAKYAVKDGGIIVLVGSCREGMGQPVFEEWMTTAKKPEELIDRIRAEFRLGGHKAAAIALVMQKASVYLVSEMDPEFVKSIFFTPFATAQEALDAALQQCGEDASIWVMPYGGSTFPELEA